MKTIWKWSLSPKTIIDMPKNAKILTVQMQHNIPQLWAMVNPLEQKEKRVFCIYGTGHDIPNDPGEYIGTFQVNNGALVFHVFETTENFLNLEKTKE